MISGESKMSISGIEYFVRRVHAKKGAMAEAAARGVKKAALFLQAKSQEVVPVDTGALKNSAFTRMEETEQARDAGGRFATGYSTSAKVGYTQSYAVYVHERTELRHKPGKIAKFLEVPARKFRKEMAKIIRDEIKRGSS